MTRAIITLMVMLASLNAYSQMNPKIDSLILNCLRMKLGSSDFDKKGIFIRRSGVTYHMADFKDTINYRNVREPEQELKAMKDVCRMLSKEAKESYLWESHEEDTDTLMYLLTLNNPTCRETLKLMYTDKNVTFVTLDDDGTSELKPKGWFEFEYHLENGDNSRNHFIDVAEMSRLIAPLLENDSIERHDLYIRHDQTYPTKVDELEYIGHATNSRLWFDTETKGTLYTIPTKEMGDRIYHQLGKVIAQYYKDHPYDIHFGLSVIPPTYDQWKWEVNLVRSQVYDYTKREDTPHEYRITFYPPGNKWDGVCRILVEETDGYLWLPKGWRNMKSWINGKAIYYKK